MVAVKDGWTLKLLKRLLSTAAAHLLSNRETLPSFFARRLNTLKIVVLRRCSFKLFNACCHIISVFELTRTYVTVATPGVTTTWVTSDVCVEHLILFIETINQYFLCSLSLFALIKINSNDYSEQ